MMAAYVKFAMASGARVVPLIWGEPEQTTMDKLSLLNGVLFPGGGGDYVEYGRSILNKLMEYNDNGLVYPAIGICLGFENMAIWAADKDRDILEPYNAHHISLPIYFTDEPANSWVFGPLGDRAYDFENNNQTLNSHSWGVDPNSFNSDAGLGSFYKLTSISYEPDIPYAPFTATMEAYDYPFFASQFHPEKTFTMFNDDSGINHSWESIEDNRYFADHFMSYARQNTHYAGDFATVQGMIVQNCRRVVTDTYYGEVYAFSSTLGCIP